MARGFILFELLFGVTTLVSRYVFFSVGGSFVEFGLDADGELGKDGAGPLFDPSPSSFRIDCHMSRSHRFTTICKLAAQYPNS